MITLSKCKITATAATVMMKEMSEPNIHTVIAPALANIIQT